MDWSLLAFFIKTAPEREEEQFNKSTSVLFLPAAETHTYEKDTVWLEILVVAISLLINMPLKIPSSLCLKRKNGGRGESKAPFKILFYQPGVDCSLIYLSHWVVIGETLSGEAVLLAAVHSSSASLIWKEKTEQ